MARLKVSGIIVLAGIDSNNVVRTLSVSADGTIVPSAEEPPLP